MARPATDLRARVLVAARDIFDARGFDGSSLRAIARAARTTIGMIYYYFPTKDDLWDAVIEEVYQRLVTDVAGILAGPGPLRAQLRRMATHVASLADGDRRVVRLALRDALGCAARRQRLFERFRRGHIPLVLQAVTRAQAAGEVEPGAPPSMIMFNAAVVVVLSQLVLGDLPLPGLPASGAARIETTLELLFHGIAGPAARTPAR